jgi:predicted amidohydrolase
VTSPRTSSTRSTRVALAQIDPRLGEIDANLSLHLDAVRAATREKARVVVFPELSLTGYLLRDQVPEVALRADDRRLAPLLRASAKIDVVFGMVEETSGHLFHNAALYLSRGRVVHVHRKIYLPTYGMFDEGRDFAPGRVLRRFDTTHGRAGMLICEDLWHPACAWLLAADGAEIFFVLSSGPSRGTRPGRGLTSVAVWHDLVRVTAQFQTAFVVYVNRVGFEDGLHFGGGSAAVDPFGRILVELPAVDTGLAVAEFDGEVLRRARLSYPLLRDDDLELAHRELLRVRAQRTAIPEADLDAPVGGRRRREGR